MKKRTKLVVYLLILCLMASMMPQNAMAAKKIRISSKSMKLYPGQSRTVKLKGTTKKPKWSSSKKSVATVSKKGKIKAKKQGNAVITAKLGKKKYKCKVKVLANPDTSTSSKEEQPSYDNTTGIPASPAVPTSSSEPTLTPTAVPTSSAEPTLAPTAAPTSSSEPTLTPTETPTSSSEPTSAPTEVPTEKPTTEPTAKPEIAKNYKKLADYLVENGTYDSDNEYYYLSDLTGTTESIYSMCKYNADGSYDFVTNFMTDSGSDLVTVTITPPEFTKGAVVNIFVQSSNASNLISAYGEVTLSTLTKTNHDITYTSTNAPTEEMKNDLYELGEAVLGLGMLRWNEIVKKAGLSLKDLGFTSYEEELVTTPGMGDNYQKLADYLIKNGEYDVDKKSYSISDLFESNGTLYSVCSYNLDGSFEFSALVMTDGGNDLVTVTITPPEFAKGAVINIFAQSTDASNVIYAYGEVVLSTLTKTNHDIAYTTTNAPTDDVKESLYELGENVLGLGLLRWESMVKGTGLGLSLKDLGFTSY